MSFSFGSFCSGIESASVAFEPLGARPFYFAEVDAYACAVLAARQGSTKPFRMPTSKEFAGDRRAIDKLSGWGARVPNWGDLTRIDPRELAPVDLLVAGTPCQAFSIAGDRLSLADPRGALTLKFVELVRDLVDRRSIRGLLWENVPDVLSTRDNAFGCLLGGLVGSNGPLGGIGGSGRWPRFGMVAGPLGRAAWRVLDGQWFGVAQRRERVFVVVDFGGWLDPAAVLFERQGLQGSPRPRRPERASDDAGVPTGAPLAFSCKDRGQDVGLIAPTVRSMVAKAGKRGNGGGQVAIAFSMRGRDGVNLPEPEPEDLVPAIRTGTGGSSKPFVAVGPEEWVLRRLTPREIERLFGFPDDYTLVEWPGRRDPEDLAETTAYLAAAGFEPEFAARLASTPDGPRYKVLGNTKIVPLVRWLGERIKESAGA